MRNYSLWVILLVGLVSYAQFEESVPEDGNIEEVYIEEPIEDYEEIDEVVIDHSDFTRGTFLDADTAYKSDYQGKEYTYTELQERKPVKPSAKPNLNVGPLLGFIFKALLIIVGLALLYFLFLAVNNIRLNRNKAVNRVVATEEENDISEPNELNDSSLQALLLRAKANGDYILAIRYYFLMYLKKLQDIDVIEYDKDKTNADYLREIKDAKLSEQFTKLSYIYEYAWYGKKEITEDVFENVERTFIDQIGNVK